MRRNITRDIRGLGVKLSKRTGIFPRDCERLIVAMFDEMLKDMKSGDGFHATHFGKFDYEVQFAMDLYDPATGGTKHVPPKTNIKFIPCKDLKYGVRALDWHDYITEEQTEKNWYKKEIKREESTDQPET